MAGGHSVGLGADRVTCPRSHGRALRLRRGGWGDCGRAGGVGELAVFSGGFFCAPPGAGFVVECEVVVKNLFYPQIYADLRRFLNLFVSSFIGMGAGKPKPF